MMPDRVVGSETPVPTTENGPDIKIEEETTVSEHEWEAMNTVLKNVYDYRDAE
jgi:hypothetical protein